MLKNSIGMKRAMGTLQRSLPLPEIISMLSPTQPRHLQERQSSQYVTHAAPPAVTWFSPAKPKSTRAFPRSSLPCMSTISIADIAYARHVRLGWIHVARVVGTVVLTTVAEASGAFARQNCRVWQNLETMALVPQPGPLFPDPVTW